MSADLWAIQFNFEDGGWKTVCQPSLMFFSEQEALETLKRMGGDPLQLWRVVHYQIVERGE